MVTATPDPESPEPSLNHQEPYRRGGKRANTRMRDPTYTAAKTLSGNVPDQTAQVARQYAEKIRGGGYVPLNTLGPKLLELIRQEGITDQQLRERGLR